VDFLLPKRLKYFIITMEELCITHAAERLYITRSPLGKVISELESKVGGNLFLRKYNKLEPTPLAFELYKKVRPVYDMIKNVEMEFSKDTYGFELIFDSSYPVYLYNYIVSALRSEKLTFKHKRTYISPEDFARDVCRRDTAIFSFRDFPHIDGVQRLVLDRCYFKVIVSDKFEYERRNEPNYMSTHPMLINKSHDVENFKRHLSFSLRDIFPLVYYEDCEMDISSMMLSVMNNNSIIVLPNKLAEIYNLSRLKSFTINILPMSKSVYHSVPELRRPELNKIVRIVNVSI